MTSHSNVRDDCCFKNHYLYNIYNNRSSPVLLKPIRQVKKRKVELDPIDIEILSQLKKSSDDEEYTFGRSVALTLKRLEVKQKAQAKIRIQQLLYDIEFPYL